MRLSEPWKATSPGQRRPAIARQVCWHARPVCDATEADPCEWSPVSPPDVPREFQVVRGGLRLGPGIVTNPAGCWRGRTRNPSRRRYGSKRWLWIDQFDPTAVARYRRRVYCSVTGGPPPAWSRLVSTCGDPDCINPHHLDLIELPPPEQRPTGPGRWGWIGEGENEQYGWIADPDPEPCEAPPPRKSREAPPVPPKPRPAPKLKPPRKPRPAPKPKPPPKPRPAPKPKPPPRPRPTPKPKPPPKGKARGERSAQSGLTEADVRAIREAAAETSQVALAARYGISRMAVQKILSRRSWAHVV